MESYRDELYHHGVKGMKWGVRRSRLQLGYRRPEKLTAGKNDTAVTKRAKSDYNKLSDSEFRMKYGNSKKGYAKRVAKSATGDPYADRRAKMTKTDRGKKRFDKAVDKEADYMTSVNQANKAKKVNDSRSTGSKIASTLLLGSRGNTAYNNLRATGSSKKGAALTLALLGTEGSMKYAERSYKNSGEGKRYKAKTKKMYYK